MAKDPGITAQRLLMVMRDRDFDQSRLAYEVGISQSAVSQILVGRTRNSRHLPRIAETLAVNLGYLVGTSDERIDMFDDAGDRITEEDLLRRGFGRSERSAAPVGDDNKPSARIIAMGVVLPNEAALADMFVGLLAAVPEGSSRRETAEILARHLPSGFEAIGPVALDQGSVRATVGEGVPRSSARDYRADEQASRM